MVLSGYADLAVVAQASSVAHQYLLKPCDPDVLRTVVERALELAITMAILGKGATGLVYRGFDPGIKRPVNSSTMTISSSLTT